MSYVFIYFFNGEIEGLYSRNKHLIILFQFLTMQSFSTLFALSFYEPQTKSPFALKTQSQAMQFSKTFFRKQDGGGWTEI